MPYTSNPDSRVLTNTKKTAITHVDTCSGSQAASARLSVPTRSIICARTQTLSLSLSLSCARSLSFSLSLASSLSLSVGLSRARSLSSPFPPPAPPPSQVTDLWEKSVQGVSSVASPTADSPERGVHDQAAAPSWFGLDVCVKR
jgi:hypothetical protein